MKFKFGEFEAEIDAVDLDFEKRLEECSQSMAEENEKIEPDGLRSERIIKYCTSVFRFFNGLFGEGTDKKMFGDKTNMRECDAAIETLSLCVSKSIDEYEKQSRPSIDKIAAAFGAKK